MEHEHFIISRHGSTTMFNKALLRQIRGSFIHKLDRRFAAIGLISIILHGLIIYRVATIEIDPIESGIIEQIPQRFAKLIIEKPVTWETLSDKTLHPKSISETSTDRSAKSSAAQEVTARKDAKKAAARQAARVEKKIRTVGVLGMLTGVGVTAQGPSVVNVLGKTSRNKERFTNLEKALEKMSGLKKIDDAAILNSKLVTSKEIGLHHKENIDELIGHITEAPSNTLTKRGSFIIQKPQSIEGAASSNVKRDNSAINKIVGLHKTSIRFSYEKYLQRIPDLAGKITVRFTIAASGKVVGVRILDNTTGSKELEEEIVRKVKMWQFESIPEGEVSVTYPFIFKPS